MVLSTGNSARTADGDEAGSHRAREAQGLEEGEQGCEAAGRRHQGRIAYRMLTAAKGTTRAAIVEATDGWSIDIKQFADRR